MKSLPNADPDCSTCKGKGHFVDSYFGTHIICSCLKPLKPINCAHCMDTGIVSDGYFGTLDCLFCKPKTPKTPKSDPKYKLDNAADLMAAKNKPGLEIVPATDKQLQLDYDYDELPEQFNRVLSMLRERFSKGQIKWSKYRSASGKHWHVVIDLPEAISNQERILWQAVFGSDYMREGLSLLRLIANIDNPTLLFMMQDRVPEEVNIIEEPAGRKFKELG